MTHLAIWALACSLQGGDLPLATLERREVLYFKRGTIELSPLGLEKIGQFVQAWGPSGQWVIGIPQGSGASDQVIRGRIRTIVSALIEQGVVGVQTVEVPPLPAEGLDPMLLGVLKADPWKGVDPNDEEHPPAPPVEPQPTPPPLRPAPSVLPPRPDHPWALGGSLEGTSMPVEKPLVGVLDTKPYLIAGVGVSYTSEAMAFALGYAKTASNLNRAEQAEPTINLNVSSQATHFFDQLRASVTFKQGFVPIQVSYADETQATTATLAKNTLLIDRNGFAWMTILDQVPFAYRLRHQTLAVDWQIGEGWSGGRRLSFGLHTEKVERPLSVLEFGSYQNAILYAANYDLVGLQASFHSDPWRAGFHADALDIKFGRAQGIKVNDPYQILTMDVANQGFNELSVAYTPSYVATLGAHGYVRFVLPLAYTKNSSKTTTLIRSNGDGQEAGLFGSSSRVGLRIHLGVRY